MKRITAKPRRIKRTPSAQQTKRRKAFRACTVYATQKLSEHQRILWENYAKKHPVETRKNQLKILTWFEMFLKINLVRLYNDVPILANPPE